MNVQIKILNNKLTLDQLNYATTGSAGLDLRAMLDVPLSIPADKTMLISTGMSIYLQDPNYAAMILPRSGLGVKHGIVLGNLVGLIDSDYQGELKVALWNRSKTDYVLQPFERMAQLVIVPIIKAQFEIVNEFKATQRGMGGFGSTGII
jgi:dUTP pyrophosphatase